MHSFATLFILKIRIFFGYILGLLDEKTKKMVEEQSGIIVEAVNNFDKLFPDSTLDNARKIVGFRNRLIHAYDAVDSSIIWAIIKKHLTPLKSEVFEKLNE